MTRLPLRRSSRRAGRRAPRPRVAGSSPSTRASRYVTRDRSSCPVSACQHRWRKCSKSARLHWHQRETLHRARDRPSRPERACQHHPPSPASAVAQPFRSPSSSAVPVGAEDRRVVVGSADIRRRRAQVPHRGRPTSRTQAAASEGEAAALTARGGGPLPRPRLVGARPRACRRAEGACLCAPEGRGPRGTRRAPPIPQAPTRERKYVSEGRGRQREMQRARAREIGNKEERDAGMQGVRDGGTVDGARGEGRRGAEED